MYPDTGTYIRSGFRMFFPDYRPIFYGIFIRHVSLYHSLWFVIIFQSWILSYLIHKALGVFIIKNKMPIWYVVSLGFITIFTSYSFQTGILIPDVFTAASILCLVILLFDTNLMKIERIGIYLLFVFSVLSHFSNVIILMSLIPVIYLI